MAVLGLPAYKVARLGIAHMPQGRQIVPDISAAWNLLLAAGLAVLLVEQAAAAALEFCDRAYMLRTGQVAADGRTQELAASGEVMKSYFLDNRGKPP